MENKIKRQGFTLFEILLVVAILLALTGIASVKKSNEQILLENAANEITSAIRYARNSYDSGNNDAYFTIVPAGDRYRVRVIENNEASIDILLDDSIRLSRKSRNDDDDDRDLIGFLPLATRPLEIRFYPNASTGMRILLESASSRSKYVVSIVPTSSRVHLYKIKE